MKPASTSRPPRGALHAIAGVALAAWVGPASAADVTAGAVQDAQPIVASYPVLEGTVGVELQGDHVVSSDDPGAEGTDIYPTVEGAFALRLSPFLAIHSDLVLEPVLDRDPFDDRAFEDVGLYAETLYAAFTVDGLALTVGKFNPGFGIAWDVTPGLYGTDFAEDYELTERIGGSVGYEIDLGDAGTHVLGAAAFFADTTILSDSVFTRRGRTERSDGGPSNTGAPESVSLTLDSSDMAALPGVAGHLGLRHQAAGDGDVDDEFGIVAGAVKTVALGTDASLDIVGEVAWFDHFQAGDSDALYATLGLGVTKGPWLAAASYTYRDLDGFNDHLIQATVGREIMDEFVLEGAYAFARTADIDSHVVGLRLSREFSFTTGQRGLTALD